MKHDHHEAHTSVNVQGTATDPVCGMGVKIDGAKHTTTHDGANHYFCSAGRKTKFETAPDTYLGKRPEPEPAAPGTLHTCPMHPEIVQEGPGTCPKRGMALEPTGAPAGDEGPNPELVDFTRRFWIGAILTVPLLVLTMGPYIGLGFIREMIGERLTLWIELLLGTPAILWAGWPFFERGYNSFRTMNLNMFSLIGMGVGAAYLFSVIAVLVHNAAGAPVTAGVLYPFLGIPILPVFAAAAMSLSSVSLVGNALRLRRVTL